jgi:hypothetical protein
MGQRVPVPIPGTNWADKRQWLGLSFCRRESGAYLEGAIDLKVELVQVHRLVQHAYDPELISTYASCPRAASQQNRGCHRAQPGYFVALAWLKPINVGAPSIGHDYARMETQ